jgi:hypothetical protein
MNEPRDMEKQIDQLRMTCGRLWEALTEQQKDFRLLLEDWKAFKKHFEKLGEGDDWKTR